jgi:hypothetical protein
VLQDELTVWLAELSPPAGCLLLHLTQMNS